MGAFADYTRITRRDDAKRGVAIGRYAGDGLVHLLIEMDKGDLTRKRHGLDELGIQLDDEQARELYVELGRLLGVEEAPLVEIESRQVAATQDGDVSIGVEPSMHGEGVYLAVQSEGGGFIDMWLKPNEASELVDAIHWAGETRHVEHGGDFEHRNVSATQGTPSDEDREAFIGKLLG